MERVVLVVWEWGVLKCGGTFEILALVGVEAECGWGCDDGVEGGIKGHGSGEEGFFVTLPRGALGEERVVVRGTVDVVIGC